MRAAGLLALLVLPGCFGTDAGTRMSFDPETKSFSFSRPWLGGPVDMKAGLELPDGTRAWVEWRSDVELDAAQAVEAMRQETLRESMSTIRALALPKDAAAGGESAPPAAEGPVTR